MPDHDTVTLKPARPGLQVRKPDGGHLAQEGEEVIVTTYWRRRLRAGDVVPATMEG